MAKRNRQPLPLLENVEIKDAGSEGKAVARVDNMVIFVPFVVPGDVIDIQVIKCDIRIVCSHPDHCFPPQAGTLQDIGLVDTTYFFIPFACHFKGNSGNALNLGFGVEHGIKATAHAILLVNSAWLGEVNPAGEFTHYQKVKPTCNDRFLE